MPKLKDEDRLREIQWVCVCEWCGKSFGANRRDARWCSKACAWKPAGRKPPVELPRPSEVQLAWAAGFFDGEGCFTARKGANGRRYLNLQIAQSEPTELLERFVDMFGVGKVYTWDRPDREGLVSTYQCHGRQAFQVADLLWPYLGEQKRAAFKRVIKSVKDHRGDRPPIASRGQRFVYAAAR